MQIQHNRLDEDRHLSLMMGARSVVSTASRSMRTMCQQQDLEAFGLRGLWEAAVRYDPDRGVPFAAYATSRVRGAIVDGLRSDGTLPRRRVSKEGLANRLAYLDNIDGLQSEEPDRLLERAQMLQLVEDVLERMAPEHADMVRRHYLEGEALADIAREQGRSRSWGSRQLELALASLRRHVEEAA